MQKLDNCIIYIRVSDPSQVENNSLETQEKACRKYAERKKYKVVKIFREEGRSAKDYTNRKELMKLLKFVQNKKNKISKVIVYKYSRFSRKTNNGLYLEALLAKKKIDVESATEPITDGPIGQFNKTILYATGQLENDIKAAIVKDNMRSLVMKGVWCWYPPIGYKRPPGTREERAGKPPIVDPVLGPIVTQIFELAATGYYSYTQLARMANALGFRYRIKKKEAWKKADHKVIQRILEKPFYYGLMRVKKWDLEQMGIHEPLVSRDLWLRANVLTNKKKDYSKQDNEIYPMKGFIKCSHCGRPMTSSRPKGRNKYYFHYECGNRKCRKARVNVDKAHEELLELLQTIRPRDDLMKVISRKIELDWQKQITKFETLSRQKANQIAELKEELRAIPPSVRAGFYTEEFAKEEAERINAEIAVLGAEQDDLAISKYDSQRVVIFFEVFLENFDYVWKKMDLTKRQTLLSLILPYGIEHDGKSFQTVTFSPLFKQISTFSEENVHKVTPRGIEPRLPG